MEEKRSTMSSQLMYIIVSIGGAVGMGNLWRFPFYLTSYGGSIFLLIYLGLIFLFGIPIVLAETAIGRRARLEPTLCFDEIYRQEKGKHSKLMRVLGFIPLVNIMLIFGWYNVVVGWCVNYFTKSFATPLEAMNLELFGEVNSHVGANWFFAILCLAITAIVCWKGVQGGIEKVSKWMVPALTVMLFILAIRGMTLSTAKQSLIYMFKPDMMNIEKAGGLGTVFLRALGAAFGSLNLGFGTYMVFGSYLDKKESIIQNSVVVCVSDTLIALLAAFAIIPVMFALGTEPGTGGAGTMFGILPVAFASIPGGRFFCILFFLLASFAGLTSLFPCTEVGICWLKDCFGIDRKKGNLIITGGIFVITTLCVLGYGPLQGVTIGGFGIFDALMTFTDLLTPISALAIAFVAAWIMKKASAKDEVTSEGKYKFALFNVWHFIVKYVAPIGIIAMLVITFQSYFG